MTFLHILLLFIASLLGGTLNSVAGGGSFFTVPALNLTGVPLIFSNTTSTVALWPGSVASTGAYRHELSKLNRVLLILTSAISIIGGILGAILLLITPQQAFASLFPFLLLMATLLFTFGKALTSRIRKYLPSFEQKAQLSPVTMILISIMQLIISVYGGYFGGGIGILMLASLEVIGMDNIHEMNALKTLLTSFINGVAVVTFIIAGAVLWLQAIIMIIGAIIGGYGGAYFARKLNPMFVRIFVIVVGFSLTIYFFIK
ncbi:MAG TPA: sulfite exporter TauE/SafE family protein [Ktedonobacteraceae bacterium]|nr:sulfite exporter TauE/SafE family protein [Ktedonobacteraceae bacterium]